MAWLPAPRGVVVSDLGELVESVVGFDQRLQPLLIIKRSLIDAFNHMHFLGVIHDFVEEGVGVLKPLYKRQSLSQSQNSKGN